MWGALSVWGKNLGKIQCVMKSAYIYHADSDWMMHDDDINCSKMVRVYSKFYYGHICWNYHVLKYSKPDLFSKWLNQNVFALRKIWRNVYRMINSFIIHKKDPELSCKLKSMLVIFAVKKG